MSRHCVALLLPAILTCYASTQTKNCREVSAITGMARARSVAALNAQPKEAGNTYAVRLVYAVRQFELAPRDARAAGDLLNLIPTGDEEQRVLMEFDGLLCDAESLDDLKVLSALRDRIAYDFSSAVLLVPEKMDAYVVYAAEAVQDPHSDYAIQMQRVCRAHHVAFLRAVEDLGAGAPEKGYFATASADWFRKHILDPDHCHALAIPEAE